MPTLPDFLSGSDFSLLHFDLEFQEAIDLKFEFLLRLRRELRAAARLGLEDPDGFRFAALFEPPLSAEPDVRRKHQKPSPAFVLLPDPGSVGLFEAGDRLGLSVVFWGSGVTLLDDFALTLQALGRLGLYCGEGRFELVGISAEDASGQRLRLWGEGRKTGPLAPPVNELRWWIEQVPSPSQVRLELLTPARLVSAGRPLFRAGFRQLFPFLLRRATSMHQAWCGGSLLVDPLSLFASAERVEEVENRMRWRDWRVLAGAEGERDLGGLIGEVILAGPGLGELWWLLRLGTLLNIGRGAAFGAGRYRLSSH